MHSPDGDRRSSLRQPAQPHDPRESAIASAGNGRHHDEALAMVEQHKLMGRGVGFVDVHLIASAKLSKAALWTRDKRLAVIAAEFGVGAVASGFH